MRAQGRGKTFVLVEHIIYKIKEEIKSFGNDDIESEVKIRRMLSEMVIMTFTNKAAAELSIRLKERILFEVTNTKGNESWEVVLRSLNLLTVGTIHGFCSKLLKQGFFSGLNTNFELISDIEFKERLKQLFEQWCNDQKEDRNVEPGFLNGTI